MLVGFMEVYLVRHTTPNIDKGVCYGRSDIGVADTFLAEVKAVKEKLPGLKKNIVFYSSPLRRCYQLAEQLTDKEIIVDDRLLELDFGDWELKKWDEIEKEPLHKWMNDFVEESCPNGESYVELDKRVQSFFEELKASDNVKIVITHAGPIRSILAHHRDISLVDSFDKIKIDYGSVDQILVKPKVC